MLRELIPLLFSRDQTKGFIMACYNWIAAALLCFVPIVCPAQESDPFSFPLPRSLDVGDRWTYSIVKIHWKAEQDTTTNTFGIFDTLSTETLTLCVVERLPMEDQTYFALSDGSLYRVDEASRTWRYDTEAESETIVWDIWGPLKSNFYGGLYGRYPWIEKPVVIDGYACEYECLSRYGPFVLRPIPEPRYEGVYAWIATVDADTVGADTIRYEDTIRYDLYLGNLFRYPYTLRAADLLKLPDWSITELYLFQDPLDVSSTRTFVVAPNVGVVYYAVAKYFYSTHFDSPSAGKVGFVNEGPPGPLDYIEKTTWLLQDVQKGDPGSSVIEDISWGQLKQRMRRPAPNAP